MHWFPHRGRSPVQGNGGSVIVAVVVHHDDLSVRGRRQSSHRGVDGIESQREVSCLVEGEHYDGYLHENPTFK